jgi:hypothetical protein
MSVPEFAAPRRKPSERHDELQDEAVASEAQSPTGPLGPGRPLYADLRASMEARFGHDFSGVRVHDDPQSAAAADHLGAAAYTTDSDIVFGAGRYQPDTVSGRAVVAHELAHVVQQAGGAPGVQSKTANQPVTAPHDPSERAADAAAQAVLSGRSPAAQSPVPAGTIQRGFGEVRVAEHKEEVFARLRLDYPNARKRNLTFSAPGGLGWATKLDTVAGGKYKDLAALWSSGAYDAFADALARHQFDLGLPERDIDGILGPGTWSRMAGLGEAMAAIPKVSKDLCYQATEARLERGHRMAAGKPFELPEDREADVFQAILASFPGRMLDVDVAYRGTGAAGALVYAGLGTFVGSEEIWKGGLKPGAAMQVWGHQEAYDLLRAGEKEEGGKRRRIRNTDTNFYGTSFVFIRYDTETTERILVRHFDDVEWHERGDFDVWIAANTTQ